MLDGRIIGAWSRTASGGVAYGLLEDVGADVSTMVESEIERVMAFLGDTRLKPSFPTPMQRRLHDGSWAA